MQISQFDYQALKTQQINPNKKFAVFLRLVFMWIQNYTRQSEKTKKNKSLKIVHS
jgi:hypothetical protein